MHLAIMETRRKILLGTLAGLVGAVGLAALVIFVPPKKEVFNNLSSRISYIKFSSNEYSFIKSHAASKKEEKLIPKGEEHAYMAKYHGGGVSICGQTSRNARDFDGDGVKDLYYICKDGARIAHLSKSKFWADFGKE